MSLSGHPFFFIDVSVIGLSETRYHTIVKICHHSGEFTGVDFSRLEGECNGQTYTNELSTSLTSVFALSRQVTMVEVFYILERSSEAAISAILNFRHLLKT